MTPDLAWYESKGLFTSTSIGITYMSVRFVQQRKEAKKCCYKRHWRYDKEYKINHSSNYFLLHLEGSRTLLEGSPLASLHVNRRPGNNICRKHCVTAGVNQLTVNPPFVDQKYSMHQHQCLERASMKPLMPNTAAFCTRWSIFCEVLRKAKQQRVLLSFPITKAWIKVLVVSIVR